MAQVAITPLQTSDVPPAAIDPCIQEPEDADTWEYEYSSTETEVSCPWPTFLIQLGLILPRPTTSPLT
jgi:hypothetical protein